MGNSASNPTIEEARNLRKQAHQYIAERKSYKKQASSAYTNNDHKNAKLFSAKAKEHGTLIDQTNARAADIIFSHYNSARDVSEIDLHELYVEEAKIKVRERIETVKSQGLTSLVIITGIGNHSVDGIPKLRPAIDDLIKEFNLTCVPDKPNRGCITILFDGPGGWLSYCTIL